MVGVTAEGPGSRELVTFLAHDPVNIGQRVLVTVVGRGRGQFDAQHCLRRNTMIPRGRRLLWRRARGRGFLSGKLPGNVQAPALGSGGLAPGPSSATVTWSESLPGLSLSFHIWEEGCMRLKEPSGPFGPVFQELGGGVRVGPAFEETPLLSRPGSGCRVVLLLPPKLVGGWDAGLPWT